MAGTALWAGTASSAKAPKKDGKPNIVFFLVDDMGWMDLGCQGSKLYQTPNIDELASRGVLFTQGYSTCHVSSPARASILTGRYPASINMTDWLPGRKNFPFQMLENVVVDQYLPKNEPTLAEALREAGYKTAIVGKWHLGEGEHRPESRGFDVHIPQGYERGWPQSYYAPFNMNGYDGQQGEYLTDRLTTDVLKYIEDNSGAPFFLYFSHFAVHDPIEGRADLVEKYRARIEAMPKSEGRPFILEGNPDDPAPLTREELDRRLELPAYKGYKILPDRTVKIKQDQDNAHFAALVESVDESLGRVVAKLKAEGIYDNTVIVFTSDNGGMSAANFGNPNRIIKPEREFLDKAFSSSNLPLRGAKGWMYEGGLRVPLIVHWPARGRRGEKCDEPVINVDFFPTLLDIAGVDASPEKIMEGVSIADLIRKGKRRANAPQRALYWHFPHYSNHGAQSPGGAIRYGDWKLIEYFEHGTVRLFNLKEDISEQNDLCTAMPEKVAELKAMLHSWQKSVGARMMPANPSYVAGGN
jgi:arylsulfatase A-like enzyme